MPGCHATSDISSIGCELTRREQNELVYSMRSVLRALAGKVKTFHLIVFDHEFKEEDINLVPQETIDILEPGSTANTSSDQLRARLQKEWRVAQTPTWLDFSKRDPASTLEGGVKYPLLRYATHTEIFHLPTYDRFGATEDLGGAEWQDQQFQKKALPNFNSMAIESRIGWLPGLSDVALSLNDDFFLLRPHAVSDFHSPLYGSVLRFDPSWKDQVKPILDKNKFTEAGEAGGLFHANWLLSHRYPRRLRPYSAHVPKVITRGLHHETSLMFAEVLEQSTRRRFREVRLGHGDVQMQWLLLSLRVGCLLSGRVLAHTDDRSKGGGKVSCGPTSSPSSEVAARSVSRQEGRSKRCSVFPTTISK